MAISLKYKLAGMPTFVRLSAVQLSICHIVGNFNGRKHFANFVDTLQFAKVFSVNILLLSSTWFTVNTNVRVTIAAANWCLYSVVICPELYQSCHCL